MIPLPKRLAILETERLRLRPLTEADVDDVFPLMGDPEAMAWRDSPEIDDPDLVAEIVRARVVDMHNGKAIHWAIRDLAEAAFFGSCELSEIDRRRRRAELGFLLSRRTWEEGHAHEAIQAVVSYAAASGLRRLTTRTHLGNRRTEALLDEFGFTEEGLLRGHTLRDGERRDCRSFGLLL